MLVLLLVVVLIILSVMFGGFQKGTKSGGLGPVGPSALKRLSTEHHAPLLSRRPLSWTATRGKQGVSIHDRGIPRPHAECGTDFGHSGSVCIRS